MIHAIAAPNAMGQRLDQTKPLANRLIADIEDTPVGKIHAAIRMVINNATYDRSIVDFNGVAAGADRVQIRYKKRAINSVVPTEANGSSQPSVQSQWYGKGSNDCFSMVLLTAPIVNGAPAMASVGTSTPPCRRRHIHDRPEAAAATPTLRNKQPLAKPWCSA